MIYVDAEQCDGCGLCVEACPQGALKFVDTVVTVDLDLCKETGTCLNTCPRGALFAVSESRAHEVIALETLPTKIADRQGTGVSRERSPAYLVPWLSAAIHFLVADVAPDLWHLGTVKRQRTNRTLSITSSDARYGFHRGPGNRRRRQRRGKGS